MIKVTSFEYAQFANLVYEDFNSPKNLDSSKLPEDWEALSLYKYQEDSPISGYFGMGFKKDDHIVIAHRGTSVIKSFKFGSIEVKEVIDSIDDYISDLQLWLNKKPQQFKAAQEYTEQVIKKYPDCSISFTGHSLGALLAQLTAAYYHKKAIVFDSPGAKEIIEKTIANKPDEIVIFNSHPNIINTINAHYTQPFLLKNILICTEKPSVKEFIFLTTQFHSMANIMQQFNTSASITTYATKLPIWPQNINEAYRFFISYDQNKILWDHCLSQSWQQSLSLQQQHKTIDAYKKNYISEKLYSESSDPIRVAVKFFEELELIHDNKLKSEDSIAHKLLTQGSGKIFTPKSWWKSFKHFVENSLLAIGNKLLHEKAQNKYEELTDNHKDTSLEDLSGTTKDNEHNEV
jgi:hypothetical protein